MLWWTCIYYFYDSILYYGNLVSLRYTVSLLQLRSDILDQCSFIARYLHIPVCSGLIFWNFSLRLVLVWLRLSRRLHVTSTFEIKIVNFSTKVKFLFPREFSHWTHFVRKFVNIRTWFWITWTIWKFSSRCLTAPNATNPCILVSRFRHCTSILIIGTTIMRVL